MNVIVKNLNNTPNHILIIYQANKPIKIGKEYLLQALFAIKIQAYSISKYSPYYPLYS